jgi:hypothetical protein
VKAVVHVELIDANINDCYAYSIPEVGIFICDLYYESSQQEEIDPGKLPYKISAGWGQLCGQPVRENITLAAVICRQLPTQQHDI